MLNQIINHAWILFALLFVVALLWTAAFIRARKDHAREVRNNRLRAERNRSGTATADPWHDSAVERRSGTIKEP